MSTTYDKPHLTLDEQASLLQRRGMLLDRPQAVQWLGMIGYYRLSGYWYPYRLLVDGARTDQFLEATTLDQVVHLYDFDRRLKLLMLDALERIEIGMRCRVGYTLGLRGAYAHLEPANFDRKFTQAPPIPKDEAKPTGVDSTGQEPAPLSRYEEWIAKVAEAQTRSHEDFVTHFKVKYDGRLPTWVVTELLDFGALSVLYQGLATSDRNRIAADLGVIDTKGGNGPGVANWMHLMNYVRNVCAHHSRFWNQNMARQVAPRSVRPIELLSHVAGLSESDLARPWPAINVVAYMLRQIEPDTAWVDRVIDLVRDQLPLSGRHPSEMGMPGTWADQLGAL